MTLLGEAVSSLRGCWRLIVEPDYGFEDFNLSIEGFWRSFIVILPLAVLAYPLFLSSHAIDTQMAAEGEPPPVLDLPSAYFYLGAAVFLWPVAAAFLTRLFGLAHHYVRYIIVYNWMSVPALAVGVLPHLVNLLAGGGTSIMIMSLAVLLSLIYLSWFVARLALATNAAIAGAFVVAEYVLSYGFEALFGI